jgi:hypothetical protein
MVGNLNVRRSCIGPNEADPELIVDADAVLSRSITYQRFKAITPGARWLNGRWVQLSARLRGVSPSVTRRLLITEQASLAQLGKTRRQYPRE